MQTRHLTRPRVWALAALAAGLTLGGWKPFPGNSRMATLTAPLPLRQIAYLHNQ